MALSAGFLLDLIELKRSGALDGLERVIEIGAQQLTNCFLRSKAEIDQLHALYGAKAPHLGEPLTAGMLGDLELLHPDAPASELFWTSLGFSYAAVEYGGIRNALPLDLNCDSVAHANRGQFDLVINAGTTEHVANQENAFRVMHDLVSPGGIMFHWVPAGGFMTHGLFTYTLKFFWHLCRENGYGVIKLLLGSSGSGPIPANVLDSNARWAPGVDYACLPSKIFDLYVVAILRKQTDRPFVTPLDLPT